ncbi:hypothetical protein [Paenibacillus lemnae]|uniref:Uncharacterized protein n=1 Tax=Paenibacillus lemnae TaxID=1330551 RepID=A0A848M5K4_PAELE|nr:hypothetical protein [Paenibacillus lemnae]NMO95539.1 hypothetical protein [Paenibacillus lemnae]
MSEQSSRPDSLKPASTQAAAGRTPREDRRTSKLGIASLAIAVITLLGYIVMASFGTAMIEPYVTPQGPVTELPKEALEAMTTLAAIFVFVVALNLTGLVLGLFGSYNKNSKRAIAIVGAIINGVVLVTILGMFIFVLNG